MGSSACQLDLRRKEEPGEMLNMTGAKPQPPCVWLHDQHHGTGALGRQANEQVWWRHRLSDETVELEPSRFLTA